VSAPASNSSSNICCHSVDSSGSCN
jgi:hypothetical protein